MTTATKAAPQSAIVIERPDSAALAAENSALVQRANAIEVRSAAEEAEASVFLQGVASAAKAVKALFEAPKRAADQAHKSIVAAEKTLLAPLDSARSVVERKVVSFRAEQQRKADAEAARLREEARKAEEAQRKRDAEAAELAAIQEAAAREAAGDAAGAAAALDRGAQESAQIQAEPIAPVAVTVAPDVAKVAGVGTQRRWKAEVTDKAALIAFVASRLDWRHLLDVNLPALNALARSQKQALAIPGVRAVVEEGLAIRA